MASKDPDEKECEVDVAPFVRTHRAIQDLEHSMLSGLAEMRRFTDRLASGPFPWYPTITVDQEE